MFSIPSFFLEKSRGIELRTSYIIPYINSQKVNKTPVLLETHLISFLLEGQKSIILQNSEFNVRDDSFLILKKGRCLMTEKLSGLGDYRSLLFFFDDDFLLHFFQKYHLEISSNRIETGFSVLKKDDLLNSIASSLIPYFDRNKELLTGISELKTEEVLLQIVELHGSESLLFLLDDPQSKRDLEFRKIVERHLHSRLNSEQLSFLCNMSTSTFRRKFIELYGDTPGKWFTRKRLEKAARMLKNSDAKPSEIFLDTGYDSLSSFIHAFKKHYGHTPRQYQRINDSRSD